MKGVHLRAVIAATLVGVLLSLLRQPLGADVLHTASTDPLRAAALRGGGLALACLLFGVSRERRARRLDFALVLAGFCAHALWLQAWWWPSDVLGFAGTALPVAALVAWLMRAEPGQQPLAEPAAEAPPGVLALLGAALGAAGGAIALEVLARHVRLLGLGTPSDDSAQAGVLLLAIALGALAFGGLVRVASRERASFSALLAAAAVLALIGYDYLRQFEDPALLQAFLKRYDLDGSHIGTLGASFAIAGSAFVAPAFALGAGLCGARGTSTWVALACGALCGSIAVPLLYESSQAPLDLAAARASHGGARWIAIAASVGAAGALCTSIELFARKQRSAWIALAAALGAAAWPWTREQRAALLVSPWQRLSVQPTLVIDAPAGLLTVEPLADGTLVATHDRLRLTPGARDEHADELRFDAALRTLRRPAASTRLLLVGVLTPARQHMLSSSGLADWRWTCALGNAARELAAALQGGFDSEPQRWIEPDAARAALERAAASVFAPDLVIVMPTYGPALSSLAAGRARTSPPPAPRKIGVPEHAVPVACWLDPGSGLCAADLLAPIALSFGGPEEVSVLRWIGERMPAQHEAGASSAERIEADASEASQWIATPSFGGAPTAWEVLRTRPQLRASRARARFFDELARTSTGSQREFVQALATWYGAQVSSSPWETDAQQLELDASVLDALSRVAADGLDPAERELWSALAGVLADKRMPDLVVKHLAPLAARHPGWPEVEHALARAYMEFDMPSDALARLEAMVERTPYDIGLLLETAAAARAAHDHAREVRWLRAAEAIQPGRHDIERLLGVALVRSGDPAGKALVREALLRDPDDSALEPFMGPGPYPPPDSGYSPSSEFDAHDHAEHDGHAEDPTRPESRAAPRDSDSH